MTIRQRLVLIVAILASGVAFLDGSIVNVALPAIQRDLGGGLATQQWVVDAYLITLGALILIAGSLSDLFGRRRVLMIGLGGFLVTSLLCAVAPTAVTLIAARALQGVAGALLVPSSLAILMTTFKGKALGKAIGSWTAWTGISFIIGPLLGGFLVDDLSWRLIFAVNVLPIALTVALLQRLQFAHDQKSGVSVDVRGAVLCALGLGGPVYALIEQPRLGWHSAMVWTPLLAGTLVFVWFLVYERRARNPMLPLDLFKFRNFSAGNAATLAIYACLAAATFIVVLFLQQVSGFSALDAGLALLPITLMLLLLASRFGALSGRFGPRWFMTVGPFIIALGAALLWRVATPVHYWTQVFPAVLLFGLGLAVTVAPLTAAVLGEIPERQSGIASAINNAVARVAGLLAVAGVGAVMAAQFASSLERRVHAAGLTSAVPHTTMVTLQNRPLNTQVPVGIPPAAAQSLKQALNAASLDAFHRALVVLALLLILGGLVSLVGIRTPRPTAD